MNEFKLFDIDNEAEPIETPQPQKTAPNGLYNPIARQREAEEKARQVYADHQANILKSGQLRSDILKGIQQAESPYNLLLKAIECISLMTGDSLLYTQSKTDIKAIYGAGLLEPAPLEIELQEVKKRLNKLLEAEQRETDQTDRNRIKTAIQAHLNKIDFLERSIHHEKQHREKN